jgi:tripartite-type tricarboxylate transporter receptor subunit TctC
VTFGGPDAVPRMLAQKMTDSLGRQVLVEPRLGAGGTIGAEYAARSPADGYTLVIGTSFLGKIVVRMT